MHKVSIVGLGAMGAALARALLRSGYVVTVWNRTSSKCQPLADAGAVVATSVLEAVEASAVVIVCVLDYVASDALLRTPAVAGTLGGKLLVQLSTGTPHQARQEATWA